MQYDNMAENFISFCLVGTWSCWNLAVHTRRIERHRLPAEVKMPHSRRRTVVAEYRYSSDYDIDWCV